MTGPESLRQVEAKYPALLFKQQLTAYVEKIYGLIRDNLKKEISPLLGLCIQVLQLISFALNLSGQQFICIMVFDVVVFPFVLLG